MEFFLADMLKFFKKAICPFSRKIWNYIFEHKAISISVGVFLGWVYYGFFFIPLDIPIFLTLSSASDFAGSILLYITAAILTLLTVLIGLFIVLFFYISICLHLRYQVVRVWNVWNTLIGISKLVLTKSVEICRRSRSKEYRSDKEMYSLRGELQRLKEERQGKNQRSLENFREKLKSNRKRIKSFLAGDVSKILFVLLVAIVVIGKGHWDSRYVKNYDWQMSSQSANCYKTLFWPASKVTVYFRPGDTAPQNLLQVGATSNFVLFWQKEEKALIVPKVNISKILPVSCKESFPEPATESVDNRNGAEETKTRYQMELSPENNPWINSLIEALGNRVTEKGDHAAVKALRPYISDKKPCPVDQLQMSELILFDHSSAELTGKENERKIQEFVDEYSRLHPKPKPITVFGFASADGIREPNQKLAAQRARAVRAKLCEILGINGNCPDQIEIKEKGKGEKHPINGVADSRSAVITTCPDVKK